MFYVPDATMGSQIINKLNGANFINDTNDILASNANSNLANVQLLTFSYPNLDPICNFVFCQQDIPKIPSILKITFLKRQQSTVG